MKDVFSKNVKKHLWLDLEDTVIEPVTNGWFNTRFLNTAGIERFIHENKPDFVHIFSFAIWDEQQLLRFNMAIREQIEKKFGVKLSAVPTVDDSILPVCAKMMQLAPDRVSFMDCSDFWGKQQAFRLNMRHLWKDNTEDVEVILIDDCVFTENFEWPDIHVNGRIINVEQL